MTVRLQPGDLLPPRRLVPLAGDGPPVRIGPLWQRAQAIVLTHAHRCEECASYLASFEGLQDRFDDEKADVLAVVGSGWQEQGDDLTPSVPALVDDGVMSARLSAERTPVVVVADRFGQIFSLYDAGEDHRFPDHEEVLNRLLDIAIRCPECGVPDIPSPTELPELGSTSGGIRVYQ